MAAFLPLALDVEPLVAPLVAKAVVWVEHLFVKHPKQGALKAATVNAIGKTLADTLFQSGLIKTQATDQQIAQLTESVFQSLNTAGIVNNPTNTAVAASEPMPSLGTIGSGMKVTGTLYLG
jgi:uncharacterized membrane protein